MFIIYRSCFVHSFSHSFIHDLDVLKPYCLLGGHQLIRSTFKRLRWFPEPRPRGTTPSVEAVSSEILG